MDQSMTFRKRVCNLFSKVKLSIRSFCLISVTTQQYQDGIWQITVLDKFFIEKDKRNFS